MAQSRNDETNTVLFASENKRSFFPVAVSVFFAFAVVCALLYSFLYLRKRHAALLPAAQQSVKQPVTLKPRVAPQAQIAQNETWVRNGQAVIGGTVRNISREKLIALTIEMELKSRADGHTENRTLSVMPQDLVPDQEGKFSLHVPSREFMGLRILGLKGGNKSDEVAFVSVPGTVRPAERSSQSKTVVVERPAQRRSGEEFLNTPDNPEKIR